MNIASAKQQVKDTVEAYLRKDDAGMYVIAPAHQRPVFLLGAPGIGKTAIMEQVARELGIGIVAYSMTHHTRQSALGLPRIEHHEFEGFEYEASEYTMSEIVASIYDYIERTGLRDGILFLDEINCVSETLYPSMLQFLQFKTFGKHKIPDGWVVVCAGNPPEYNRSVHEFDIVTLDRLREIDVEPDYASWKSYAADAGLHPAVTTFLETKSECFYKVESKPGGGKAFVTARGWEDLARVIALYEDMGKPVNRDLVVQFLRDEVIADQFAVYYTLFEKYRSDYQVDAILAGEASEAIKQRAAKAAFDERVALVGLLLDALSRDCAAVLERENVVLELRDTLRAAKPVLMGGGSVDEACGQRLAERERTLARRVGSGVAAGAEVRKERLVIGLLKDFMTRCVVEGSVQGEAAFRVIEVAYKAEVARIKPSAEAAGAKMTCAFDFIESCLSGREMLVFMAELATRQSTTQYVAHYGNERYYAHNQELQVDVARAGLAERASLLEDLGEDVKLEEARTVDMGGGAGLALAGASAEGARGAGAGAGSVAGEGGAAAEGGAVADGGVTAETGGAASGARGAAAGARDWGAHYANRQFEYGFASVCKMVLPASDLAGKRVLDVCCRRGKGVYKLSSLVGSEGSVIGIDWNAAYVAEAKDGAEHARRKNGLARSNMEFHVAYPEDLIAAGIGSQSVDVVYVNNVVTLLCDPSQALREFGRVLKPGGLLVLETVVADRARNEEVVKRARELGNSIQAARTWQENCSWLFEAGFAEPAIEEEYEVEANRGYKPGSVVEVVPGDEDVRYKAVALYVRKK